MSLDTPIFDNIYLAAGVAGLLIVLLVLLLVLMRRRRAKEDPAATATNPRSMAPPPLAPPLGTPPSAPPLGAPPPAPPPGTVPPAMPSTAMLPGMTAPVMPTPGVTVPVAIPPVPIPGPGNGHPPGGAGVISPPFSVAPAPEPTRVGDPVVAMIVSLLDAPGDLTDAGLRRLELFKPERVLRVVDEMSQSLTGRGKEAKRVRLGSIRQYAQSLKAQPQPPQMPAQAGAPSPVPLPPPGSGTRVPPPEAWGVVGDSAGTIPLDTELSYLGDTFEPVNHPPSTPEIASPFGAPLETTMAGADKSQLPTEAPADQAALPAIAERPDVDEEPSAASSEIETPEPPPAFPLGAVIQTRPQPAAVPERPAVPQPPPAFPVEEPPAFAIREAPASGVSPIEESLASGGPAEEWERPAVVERDTFRTAAGEPPRPHEIGTVRTEMLIAMNATHTETTRGTGGQAVVEPASAFEPASAVRPSSAVEPTSVPSVGPVTTETAAPPSEPHVPPGIAPDAARAAKLDAITGWEMTGSADALGALEEYLDDPDPEVLMRALEAAERLLAILGGPPV